jgi:hypothetical protein
MVAAAMIDRLLHHAEVLTLTGGSYRTRARRELLAKNRAGRLDLRWPDTVIDSRHRSQQSQAPGRSAGGPAATNPCAGSLLLDEIAGVLARRDRSGESSRNNDDS